MECTNDVCGMRCVGRQKKTGSIWWNEEVGGAVAEREELLRNGYREGIGRNVGLGRVRGCMDHVFAIRLVYEKYLANRKDAFRVFMDLEKAYDSRRVCLVGEN